MTSVLRGLAVFITLLLVFRIAGKRTLHETTTFDFVLILIIAETVQQAMIDNDSSYTNALVLISTLIGVNVLFSVLKQRFRWFAKLTEGTPVVLIENGTVHRDRMEKERVDDDDVLNAARESHGLRNMSEVESAVMERSGTISVLPRKPPASDDT
jgi:uncharacterized membrane protein YcaP (DUF421 family)